MDQIPICTSLRGYKRSWFTRDMVAGLTLWAVLVPEALAYATIAGVSPVAAHLGKKDRFDQSIMDFAERYADQNERDYRAFTDAISSGRLPVLKGV